MKGIVIIVTLFIIYTIDNIFCYIYASLKRKSFESRKLNVDIPTEKKNSTGNSSVRDYIINFVEGWIRYRIIRIGRFPSHKYREFIMRHVFKMNLENNVVLHYGFEIRAPWNIHVGEGTIIGDNCILDGRNGIDIGKNVNFSSGVWIWTEEHDHDDPWFGTGRRGGTVVIGNRAWLSCRTIILPRIHIGEGSVVAAGAVVTKNLDAFKIYGGVPAKVIGERSKDLKYHFDGSTIPFY